MVFFLASAATGFAAAEIVEGAKEPGARFPLTEVNSSEEVATASFYNQSIDLLMEDGANATFYLDLDQDGGFERRLDTKSDGNTRGITELVDLNGTSYRLNFEYRDSSQRRGDAWLRLIRAERL